MLSSVLRSGRAAAVNVAIMRAFVQMLMYLGYFEANEIREGENPPIGLILGADKNDTAVRTGPHLRNQQRAPENRSNRQRNTR